MKNVCYCFVVNKCIHMWSKSCTPAKEIKTQEMYDVSIDPEVREWLYISRAKHTVACMPHPAVHGVVLDIIKMQCCLPSTRWRCKPSVCPQCSWGEFLDPGLCLFVYKFYCFATHWGNSSAKLARNSYHHLWTCSSTENKNKTNIQN